MHWRWPGTGCNCDGVLVGDNEGAFKCEEEEEEEEDATAGNYE